MDSQKTSPRWLIVKNVAPKTYTPEPAFISEDNTFIFDNNAICRNIAGFQKVKNISNSDLTTRSGIPSLIKQISGETAEIPTRYICAIAEILGVTLNELIPIAKIEDKPKTQTIKENYTADMVYSYKGLTGNAHELSKHFNVKYEDLQYRLRILGWGVERAIADCTSIMAKPVDKKETTIFSRKERRPSDIMIRQYTYKGVTGTVNKLADTFGIPSGNLYSRLKHGWDIERSITEPVGTVSADKYEYKGKMSTLSDICFKNKLHFPSMYELVRRQKMRVEDAEELLATKR